MSNLSQGKIIVTGGAGYIGSHVVKKLQKRGFDVTVIDDLSAGHRWAVKDCDLIRSDIGDIDALDRLFSQNRFSAVMHFAASALVGESVERPDLYWENNVLKTYYLLRYLCKYKIKNIIFSSSASVYGEPQQTPITEAHCCQPINPYGFTKLAAENMLDNFAKADYINYISLRYFNAAGADPEGDIGELHNPETHLIPLLLKTALGEKEKFEIYGTDYPTSDGTCIRDFIHVNDLAEAHIISLEWLKENSHNEIFNLGNERGYSVKKVIKISEKVTGKSINIVEKDRRPGDPTILVASSEKIERMLGWKPEYKSLEDIIETAWRWHNTNTNSDLNQKSN